MRILYTTNNMVQPYCRELYIVPLVIIVLVSLFLGVLLLSDYIGAGITFIIIMLISLVFLVVCSGYEEQQGYKYYVALEENEQIDLTKYNIEEQKGDLYIITDK